jgi:hypothetical protein
MNMRGERMRIAASIALVGNAQSARVDDIKGGGRR